jgi:GNAT superfamily N-acetyltransferase
MRLPFDPMITLTRTTADDPAFLKLAGLLDRELRERYGALQDQYDLHNDVENAGVVVLTKADDVPVGCGCFLVVDEHTVEIKRMFVTPAERGKGIATNVLRLLERVARERGFTSAILETGVRQPEAVRLYEREGYRVIDNYGPYVGMPESICLRKDL